ncbi:complement C1q tumor necrosis factor-related protein 4-like [Dunckerocampus dactyliophorus]|uniref:complement C1q tumor necrosis factor-related protein 4-like n=1 Tax=Dunckerocampus dactyliophorus TaxID=161453 RepID=UPI0024074D94|nr:complement C1q tumor necrosis factor-related protein 4-like [Dunckerocampus dactyliophorus]
MPPSLPSCLQLATMSLRFMVLLVLAHCGWAQPIDSRTELNGVREALENLKADRRAMMERLNAAERELKRVRETPKVAFAASLGGNGAQKTLFGNKDLIYRDVLTNVGGAYNAATGEFTAPIRGVYYIRFTANAPTDFTMSAVLYKNNDQVQLIAHEQPSGKGSDTASNGAALLLEKGDKLKMVLWHNTHIWDNSNHHSTFSGFLLFPLVDEPPMAFDVESEMRSLQASVTQVQAENADIKDRLETAEKELKAIRDVPKVAFAASLGGNGLQKTTTGMRKLLYKEVLTNIGEAYDQETGEFTAPVRGVYYIRFTTNAPTDFTMSAVLYKNNNEIQLITHEQPSGEGSDTASNGAALLLEKGDKLSLYLWQNTQIWDNSNHHSTFSGFLLFPM